MIAVAFIVFLIIFLFITQIFIPAVSGGSIPYFWIFNSDEIKVLIKEWKSIWPDLKKTFKQILTDVKKDLGP